METIITPVWVTTTSWDHLLSENIKINYIIK